MGTATQSAKVRAARIKEIRLNLRLTQRGLAERLGIDPITVSRWERGETVPSDLNRVILARLGGVHPNHLRGEELA